VATNRADRIRRVLSDGVVPPRAPARRRLREVPPEEADGADDTTPAPRTGPPLDPALKRRLEALGVTAASSAILDDRRRLPSADDDGDPAPGEDLRPPAVAPDAPPWPEPGAMAPGGEPLDLAGILAAGERTTAHGPFLQVERRIPLGLDHGRVPLADALAHAVPLRPHERGPGSGARLDAREAVFIDTETSGLAGGTGTVAFLVGAGWIEDDDFVVRQYFMRDYPEEGALLEALHEDLGDAPLVSFNGRSFDWPLLTTRWRLNRRRPGPRAHFDLLPPARRLWGRTLHSHSLSTIERHVLGLQRGEDMPGHMIPGAWFDYLRTGHGATLAAAFRHNEIDVVSMLALFGRVGAILSDPVAAAAAPADRVGTARLLLELRESERAQRCLEVGLAQVDEEEGRPIRRMLGHMYRRAGDYGTALDHWLVVAGGPGFDPEAYEQVAKIYEHRVRDFGEALRWTREALDRVESGSRMEGAFQHRAKRLERRIARSGG
jgi:uncharacterized protein YprB with RNaseH-like and TPR domain